MQFSLFLKLLKENAGNLSTDAATFTVDMDLADN